MGELIKFDKKKKKTLISKITIELYYDFDQHMTDILKDINEILLMNNFYDGIQFYGEKKPLFGKGFIQTSKNRKSLLTKGLFEYSGNELTLWAKPKFVSDIKDIYDLIIEYLNENEFDYAILKSNKKLIENLEKNKKPDGKLLQFPN